MVITSYEIIIADAKALQPWEWTYCVVDEGHRLKNYDCRLLRELRTLRTHNKLLLTGELVLLLQGSAWPCCRYAEPELIGNLSMTPCILQSTASHIRQQAC